MITRDCKRKRVGFNRRVDGNGEYIWRDCWQWKAIGESVKAFRSAVRGAVYPYLAKENEQVGEAQHFKVCT